MAPVRADRSLSLRASLKGSRTSFCDDATYFELLREYLFRWVFIDGVDVPRAAKPDVDCERGIDERLSPSASLASSDGCPDSRLA